MQEADKRAHLYAMRHLAGALECLRESLCEAKRSPLAQAAVEDTPVPSGLRS